MTDNKKVSIILLDWNVRESYHTIEYLNQQKNITRSDYEVIWIEYFNKKDQKLSNYAQKGFIDKYVVLNRKGVYKKHAMYNEGVLLSKGEVIIVSDSDAMYPSNFVCSVIEVFNDHADIVLYFDEIRNSNPIFYPFRFPDWEEVLNIPGLINWNKTLKTTTGLAEDDATLKAKHGFGIINLRNYGACFCARRSDIIRLGGFDEHESYEGHICGPYELGWRMVNAGFKEIWHPTEFLMHVYHPWVTVERDVVGPHIRYNSATALKHKEDGTLYPIVENKKIKQLRTSGCDKNTNEHPVVSIVISSDRPELWDRISDSISNAISVPYEVIMVGPTPSKFSRKDLVYIESDVKPVQCREIGIRAAKGKYIAWATDNCLFKSGSIDEALETLYKMGDERRIIIFKFMETFNSGVSWFEGDKNVLNGIICAEFGIMPKSYFMKIGGFDVRFIETCAETDLAARIKMDDGNITATAKPKIDVRRKPYELIMKNNPHDFEMLCKLWHNENKDRPNHELSRASLIAFKDTEDIYYKCQGPSDSLRHQLIDKHSKRFIMMNINKMEDILSLLSDLNRALTDRFLDGAASINTQNSVNRIIEGIHGGFLYYLSQTGYGLQCIYNLARNLKAGGLTDESVSLYLLLIENIPLLAANRTVNEAELSSSFFPACCYDIGSIFYEKNDLQSAIKYLAKCLVVLPTSPKARRLFDKICKVYLINH